MPKPIRDFNDWFTRLLNVNGSNSQFGLGYPMGSACYRDVLRDKKVKEALKDSWERHIELRDQNDDQIEMDLEE